MRCKNGKTRAVPLFLVTADAAQREAGDTLLICTKIQETLVLPLAL